MYTYQHTQTDRNTPEPRGRLEDGTQGGIIISGIEFPPLHHVQTLLSQEGLLSSRLHCGTTWQKCCIIVVFLDVCRGAQSLQTCAFNYLLPADAS